MKTNLHVSHRYTRLKDNSFGIFAGSVILNMTGNPAYPNPAVPLAELSALQADFGQKLAATCMGGKVVTAAKISARAALTQALRRQGIYVQDAATDLVTLLSSGYSCASQNRSQAVLARPMIRKILNEAAGQLTLRVTPIANARNYQVQMRAGDGAWQEAGIFSQARRMVVMNLTSGTLYNIRVRALGGSTGYSEWSMVISRVSL
jgi:Fibronectin type III domain